MAAKELGVEGGMEWEAGVSRYKLLCIRLINIKVLLSSMENYILLKTIMDFVLGPAALGGPGGIGWRGRGEGGSGWGIHVYPRLIHVNV